MTPEIKYQAASKALCENDYRVAIRRMSDGSITGIEVEVSPILLSDKLQTIAEVFTSFNVRKISSDTILLTLKSN